MRVEAMNRLTGLIEPIVVMAFGAYLGLVNQSATGTSGWLRVPALLAALILVAQGILSVQKLRSPPSEDGSDRPLEVDAAAAEVVAWQTHQSDLEHPGRAHHRDVPIHIKVTGTSSESPSGELGEKPQTIYLVMTLAIWLGLASLANPAAPKTLLVLSLLSAFLLFAEAWQMMRRTG